MFERTFPTVAIGASILAAAAIIANAGPLNPPAGPVTSTLKALSEVEPRIAINSTNTPGDADSVFRISQSGSYYLTGTASIAAINKSGIEIAASHVTIDLMGFSLIGVSTAVHGIRTSGGAFNNITIRNGTISGFPQSGIDLTSAGTAIGSGARLENLLVSGNGGVGLRSGNASTVTNCVASQNGAEGFRVENGGTISGCAALSNQGNGIVTGVACSVGGCTANLNGGVGIRLETEGMAFNNCASRNTLDGILATTSCMIRSNECVLNGFNGDGAGIHTTGPRNRIEGNNCVSADRGIDVDNGGNFIRANTCSANAVNWDVVGGNKCLVILGANSGVILGSSGGVSPGSTDPNANFTY